MAFQERYSWHAASTRAYLLATGFLLILLTVSLVFYFFGSRLTKNGNQNVNVNTNTTTPSVQASIPVTPEPDIMASRVGTLTEITSSSLRLDSAVYNQQLGIYEQKSVTADVGKATKYTEINKTGLPYLPAPGETAPPLEQKSIAKSDLKVGDTLEVFATSNIRDKMKFDASEVHRMITK